MSERRETFPVSLVGMDASLCCCPEGGVVVVLVGTCTTGLDTASACVLRISTLGNTTVCLAYAGEVSQRSCSTRTLQMTSYYPNNHSETSYWCRQVYI